MQQAWTLEPSLYLQTNGIEASENCITSMLLKSHVTYQRKVLAYVVVEDGHEAHVAVVRTGSQQCRSPAGALGNDAVRSLGKAGTIFSSG